MDVRILETRDARQYRALHLDALAEAPEAFAGSYRAELARPLEQVAGSLIGDPDRFILGAFDDTGTLIGMAGFGRARDRGASAAGVLWGMYVRREHRRRGVGLVLVTELLEIAGARPGMRLVSLGVRANNGAAIALYRRAGFTLAEEEGGGGGPAAPQAPGELLMQRSLREDT